MAKIGFIVHPTIRFREIRQTLSFYPQTSIKTFRDEHRDQRKWWSVHNGQVREVTGYSCKPNNPTVWWCPQIGVSATEGYHLFETRDEAYVKAIEEAEQVLSNAKSTLKRLRTERKFEISNLRN